MALAMEENGKVSAPDSPPICGGVALSSKVGPRECSWRDSKEWFADVCGCMCGVLLMAEAASCRRDDNSVCDERQSGIRCLSSVAPTINVPSSSRKGARNQGVGPASSISV